MGPLGGLGGWYPHPPRSYQPTYPFQPSQVIPSLVDPRSVATRECEHSAAGQGGHLWPAGQCTGYGWLTPIHNPGQTCGLPTMSTVLGLRLK